MSKLQLSRLNLHRSQNPLIVFGSERMLPKFDIVTSPADRLVKTMFLKDHLLMTTINLNKTWDVGHNEVSLNLDMNS